MVLTITFINGGGGFGGELMKHFIVFVGLVFFGLFLALYARQKQDSNQSERQTLHIYGPSSFIKPWGPGPWLKEKFERSCGCVVEYHDSLDGTSLLERIKLEPKNRAADLVLGLSQYDLEMAEALGKWKGLQLDVQLFEDSVRPLLSRNSFTPYDWGVLAFIGHRNNHLHPSNFDDLLKPDYISNISVQDPRTSVLGLELILWLIQVKGEEATFDYLNEFNSQVKGWSSSWSVGYSSFLKDQVKLTLSYVTSPLAILREDSASDIMAFPFSEGHPVHYEFFGIPSTCQNCDLAEKFATLMLSKEGQRVIMDKSYMLPVTKSATTGTIFENIPKFKTLDMMIIPNRSERERVLKKWLENQRSK